MPGHPLRGTSAVTGQPDRRHGNSDPATSTEAGQQRAALIEIQAVMGRNQ